MIGAEGPVVGDGGDAAQRISGVGARGVDLADDLMLRSHHLGQRRQCRAHAVAAIPAPHRIQACRRLG
ncbi:hypothetical protein AFM11_20170 [Mycolicibacterium wolinskyi]|uniref:Uncharacterized protein n=1 Tax=Mycolicibacterium wolinskyi TaxID=59750 RepID=A0A132PJF7_9MYCO|nr:hypothetical protein AFM11_20170 [Mycolicibacterium wolinskyi]